MFQHPDLTGRVAIVTGSSRGIGKALALALAKAGCDVTVAAKSLEARPGLPGSIVETAEEIRALGRRALPVQTNVREADEVQRMVQRTVDELGRVDILINNAGALWWKNVADTPIKRFDLVVDVNVRAAFAAAHFCLAPMLAQGYGHIINMSPPLDMRMLPGKVAYCISKFGMTLLAQGLAAEVKGRGVAVNALWPATAIESQATINFGLGGPAQWRRADILVDAAMAILSHHPDSLTAEALIDEDILSRVGVTDFDRYLCVPGGTPIRIIGDDTAGSRFGHGAGGPASR